MRFSGKGCLWQIQVFEKVQPATVFTITNRVGTGASVFYRAGIIEKWGTGTLNIIEWCKENGNSMPQLSVRAGSVVLIFKPMRDKIARQPESLRERIIESLRKEPLSRSELSRKLGHKKISGQLNKVLKELLEQGVISYTIPEKPTSRLQKYMLAKKF